MRLTSHLKNHTVPPKTHKPSGPRRLEPLDPEVLTAAGAAQVLGVSARLVLRLARQAKLPGKKVGKEWRFRRTALLPWLGKTEPPAPWWVEKLVAMGRAQLNPPRRR
jgi:excisionase family DNA binding protein